MNHQAAFTQFFSELEDPRQTTKIAYPFFDVVFLTVCAAIGGAQGWEDIELFGEAHLEWFQRNGLFHNGLPVHDTIARIISRIQPEQFQMRIPVKLNSDSGICEHHFRKVCGQGFFEQKLSFEGRHLFDSPNKPAAKRSAAVVDPRRWNRTVHLTSEYVH